VKFGIKSLNISELLVDVPESATVGSLKLAVLEAVTQILKGGLNIGVLFQGKTIVDDSKTLLQIGIPYDDDDDENLGSLGFMLEPQKSETTTITTLTTVSPRTRLRYTIKTINPYFCINSFLKNYVISNFVFFLNCRS